MTKRASNQSAAGHAEPVGINTLALKANHLEALLVLIECSYGTSIDQSHRDYAVGLAVDTARQLRERAEEVSDGFVAPRGVA